MALSSGVRVCILAFLEDPSDETRCFRRYIRFVRSDYDRNEVLGVNLVLRGDEVLQVDLENQGNSEELVKRHLLAPALEVGNGRAGRADSFGQLCLGQSCEVATLRNPGSKEPIEPTDCHAFAHWS